MLSIRQCVREGSSALMMWSGEKPRNYLLDFSGVKLRPSSVSQQRPRGCMGKPTVLLWAQGCGEVLHHLVTHPLSMGSFQLLVLEQGVCAPLVRGRKAAGSESFQSSLQSAFRSPNLVFIFVIFKKEQTSGFPCAC